MENVARFRYFPVAAFCCCCEMSALDELLGYGSENSDAGEDDEMGGVRKHDSSYVQQLEQAYQQALRRQARFVPAFHPILLLKRAPHHSTHESNLWHHVQD